MQAVNQVVLADEIIAGLVREFGSQVQQDVPLAGRTTMKVGGIARLYLTPHGTSQLQGMLARLKQLSVPVLVLGGGANVVVADEGVSRAAVISVMEHMNNIADIRIQRGQVSVTAEAGVRLTTLVQFCQQQGWGGMEFLAGIPGSVGGAAVMNAGAFGREFGDLLMAMSCCDYDGQLSCCSRNELFMTYRDGGVAPDQVVVSVCLLLQPALPETIAAKMAEYREIRRQRQPWGVPSAGSVFKNPPGDYAGRLIEAAGCRGRRQGKARVADQHANFITTEPGATAADVFRLIDEVKMLVYRQFGVLLEEEIIRFSDDHCLVVSDVPQEEM
ncbi:MAG: UDP-N-acetylmuramate dehydrogenase [Deltaproteobacteria bacterium]|nr:UDP-N-acetylmuramate dehydrogenase [Candidatus Anaeroferrophillus wilburensis]MBN2888976.1 UDP-N-acetylmuramate dehydrogenase [Deltaproteobacteria bacterium]